MNRRVSACAYACIGGKSHSLGIHINGSSGGVVFVQ